LIKDNNLLANLLRDEGYLSKFAILVELENETDMWVLTDDRIEILLLGLETISILVTTSSPQDVFKNQVLTHLLPLSSSLLLLPLPLLPPSTQVGTSK
jgi:hypothetical protein